MDRSAFCKDAAGVTPCECKAAGWCERHKMQKSDKLLALCQSDECSRYIWDLQKKAREVAADRNKPRPPPADPIINSRERTLFTANGVGTIVYNVLKSANIETNGCQCRAKSHEWNRNGLEWCKANRHQLVDWL